MKIANETLSFATKGYGHMIDVTEHVAEKLAESGMQDGLATVFVPGSTGGFTTIEHESGLVEDFSAMMERLIPQDAHYHHDARWGDGNGFSHVRAALLGPSLTVPFSRGRLSLGTWQQIIFVDFDNRPRSRNIILQFMGE
ncbi:MAG: YjbQ family protein [Candidatus Aminicenantes bacterium]|nr:YjbQ family protein [Candidatus Aminicenantes bacterium]